MNDGEDVVYDNVDQENEAPNKAKKHKPNEIGNKHEQDLSSEEEGENVDKFLK